MPPFYPTDGMAEEAKRGLAWRREFKRGGTSVGVARANQLKNKEGLSLDTVKRMFSFFSRHERATKGGQGFKKGQKGYPSAGRIAWALWGGDAGQSWSRRIWQREKKKLAKADSSKVSDSVEKGLKNKLEAHREKVGSDKRKQTTLAKLKVVYNRGIGAYRTNPSSVRPTVKSPQQWASARVNSFLYVLRNLRFRSGKHDQDLLPSSHPMATKNQEINMSESNEKRFTFQVNVGNVNKKEGVLKDVVIIEAGEARGHRMMISEKTLDAAVSLLGGDTLPAFITHNGAFQDRLMNTIGAFSGFYRDEDKIRAERFEALESWMKAEPEKYERLFDLAEKMPKTFGISIVFEGVLAWETEDGEEPYTSLSERPEGATFELPTITPSKIQSADFVDTPAATSALFSEKWDKEINNEEAFIMPEDNEQTIEVAASESASAELERRQAEESASEEPKAEVAEEKPKRKKKLEEPESIESEELDTEVSNEELPDSVELSEHAAQLNERDSVISEQEARILELENQVATLKAIFGGEDEIEDDLAQDEEPEKTTDQLKAESIEEHLRANPRDSRMTAVLAVYKTKPELFSAN